MARSVSFTAAADVPDVHLRAVEAFERETPSEDGEIRGEPGTRLAADPLVGAHLRGRG